MLDDRILTFAPDVQRQLTQTIRRWFAPEDRILQTVRTNTVAHGLPEIQIRPEEGQMLQFLAAIIGARRIMEIGTLAGYSGIWLARGLPPGGRLVTLELDPRHAQIARQHFALAGVSDRIEIVEGDAAASLERLGQAEPFDMVFIDANKEANSDYLAWSLEHVRSGGLITAHNAFREGHLHDDDAKANATRAFLEALATHAGLFSTVIPVGDGLAAALVK
jgi:caffeoyl-CoA O-methyltransferase